MPSFRYTARSQSGEVVKGMMEAIDNVEAAARVKQMYPFLEELTEIQTKENKSKLRRVSVKLLSLLCSRFSTILNAGVPLVQAVTMVAGQVEDKNLSQILWEVSRDVSMGRSLSAALIARGDLFPTTFIETIRSGEESGDLAMAFERMSSFYDRSSKRGQKIVSSMIYPCIVMVVAIIVVIIIMVVAVPAFTTSFASMGVALPLPTRMVMAISNFFVKYGIFVLIAIAIIAFFCRSYAKTTNGAIFFGTLMLKLPLGGKIIRLSAASQFAHTMSMMLAAGLPMLRCMETAGNSIGNYILRNDVLSAITGVEGGSTLGNCLSKSQYFPSLLLEMVAMGEATGTLETTLETVGIYYDNEVDVATARAVTMLEPAIIGFLAVVVVLILFAVYAPMFSMYGNM